jgi:hypothetical protein
MDDHHGDVDGGDDIIMMESMPPPTAIDDADCRLPTADDASHVHEP